MKRVALLVLALAACGPTTLEGSGDVAPLELTLSRAFSDTLRQLRLSVVTDAVSVDCAKLQTACVKDSFTTNRYVSVLTSGGKTARSVTVDVKLIGTPLAQSVKIEGLALGKGYMLLVEALDANAKVVGLSCTPLKEVVAGTNSVTANTVVPIASALTCAAP